METIVIFYVKGTMRGTEEIVMQDNWVEQCYELDKTYVNWKVLD